MGTEANTPHRYLGRTVIEFESDPPGLPLTPIVDALRDSLRGLVPQFAALVAADVRENEDGEQRVTVELVLESLKDIDVDSDTAELDDVADEILEAAFATVAEAVELTVLESALVPA